MRTLLLVFVFALFVCGIKGQSIDELLQAPQVKDFIQLRLDIKQKKLFYQIDESGPPKKDKSLNGSVTVSSKEKNQEIVFQMRFLNPLKYKITCTDSAYLDSAYQNLTYFFQAATTLLQTISNTAATAQKVVDDKDKKGFVGAGKVKPDDESALGQIGNMNSPVLVEWRYLSILPGSSKKTAPFTYLKDYKTFIGKVSALDKIFYDGTVNESSSFIGKIKGQLDLLSAESSAEKFDEVRKNFAKYLTNNLKPIIDNGEKLLDDFEGYFKSFDFTSDDALEIAYLNYTKWAVEKFITDIKTISNQRKDVYSILQSLNTEMEAFISTSALDEDNSVIIARVPISSKNVNELNISISDRSIQVTNSEIKMSTGSSPIASGKIKVREYRTLVPEFSTGLFYSNVSYPKFGTKDDNGKSVVASAGDDRIYYVVASHLNLIFNTSGSIHPLWQIGFGTGKDLPSLLTGVGIRFSEPKRLVIAGGCMWSWIKDLDKLKIGDEVSGTAELNNDLKFKLRAAPSLYIGIQYNF